jgi:hypothetical protein
MVDACMVEMFDVSLQSIMRVVISRPVTPGLAMDVVAFTQTYYTPAVMISLASIP